MDYERYFYVSPQSATSMFTHRSIPLCGMKGTFQEITFLTCLGQKMNQHQQTPTCWQPGESPPHPKHVLSSLLLLSWQQRKGQSAMMSAGYGGVVGEFTARPVRKKALDHTESADSRVTPRLCVKDECQQNIMGSESHLMSFYEADRRAVLQQWCDV